MEKLKWVRAENIKVGDIHQYDDYDGTGLKTTKVLSTKPAYNGFKEIVGAYITWDDGTSRRYTGDLEIISHK